MSDSSQLPITDHHDGRALNESIVNALRNPIGRALGHYGSVIIQIDTAAMKRDGVEFQVEQEPAVTEYEAASCLASAIGCDDHTFESGGDGADDPATVILHIGVIDPKYLKVLP